MRRRDFLQEALAVAGTLICAAQIFLRHVSRTDDYDYSIDRRWERTLDACNSVEQAFCVFELHECLAKRTRFGAATNLVGAIAQACVMLAWLVYAIVCEDVAGECRWGQSLIRVVAEELAQFFVQVASCFAQARWRRRDVRLAMELARNGGYARYPDYIDRGTVLALEHEFAWMVATICLETQATGGGILAANARSIREELAIQPIIALVALLAETRGLMRESSDATFLQLFEAACALGAVQIAFAQFGVPLLTFHGKLDEIILALFSAPLSLRLVFCNLALILNCAMFVIRCRLDYDATATVVALINWAL